MTKPSSSISDVRRGQERRRGRTLLAVGIAGVGTGALLAAPTAALADTRAGSTIQVVVATNGQCGLENVTTHTLSTDQVAFEAPNFILTRMVDTTIPTGMATQFGLTVDTSVSGCALQQPVSVTVDGVSVPFQNNISAGGAMMTVTLTPVSQPTSTVS
ncbi:hypothetical protein, partial [Micromonospora eburnea]